MLDIEDNLRRWESTKPGTRSDVAARHAAKRSAAIPSVPGATKTPQNAKETATKTSQKKTAPASPTIARSNLSRRSDTAKLADCTEDRRAFPGAGNRQPRQCPGRHVARISGATCGHHGPTLDACSHREPRRPAKDGNRQHPPADDKATRALDPRIARRRKNEMTDGLSESQRAAVALRLANMPQGARTDIQPCANLRNVKPISQPEAADMLQVSRRSVQTAARIERDAPPEVFQAVQSGALSLNLAAAVAYLVIRSHDGQPLRPACCCGSSLSRLSA
jgi:hypothetical protein